MSLGFRVTVDPDDGEVKLMEGGNCGNVCAKKCDKEQLQ